MNDSFSRALARIVAVLPRIVGALAPNSSKLCLRLVGALLLTACTKQDVVILYDNDVHCATAGYATMAGLRDSLSRTADVTVVSAGDFAQGDVVGSLTEGEAIVRIMNTVPYDITTVGNHEFDYGLSQTQHLCSLLSAEAICCNFNRIGEPTLLPSYTIRRSGGYHIAYIGVATPTTHYTSTPTYFEDSLGNCLYDFHEQDTYQLVQQCVDEVRAKGADYVIVLSHLGDDPECAYSPELIAQTTGIDVVLDGHAHHVINRRIANAAGDSVILTSTGTKFAYIGQLTIDRRGHISTTLLPTDSLSCTAARTKEAIDRENTELADRIAEVVGHSDRGLSDCDEQGYRVVRREQCALGQFLTEAFRVAADAEIGVMNGGGIRKAIPAGDITMGDIIGVLPFNNRIWRVTATGQQLWDALAFCLRDYPNENGDYPQLSGARFTLDGTGKLKTLEVMQNGAWTAINPDATYTIGGQSYILVSGGANGAYKAFRKDAGPMMTDVEAVVNFMRSDAAREFGIY